MENITSGEVEVIPKEVRIVNFIVYIIITVIGIVGNCLVFIAYCLSRRLRTKSNIFVINLATADILTCACLPFVALFLLLDVNVHTAPWLDTLCTINFGVFGIFLYSSLMTLAFIAVNRYVLITKRKESYTWLYQRKFIFIFLCISWLYPVLFVTLPLAFGVLHIGYDEHLQACYGAHTDHPGSFVYDLVGLIITILQITMIVYSYGRIYLFLRRHNKQLQERKVRKTVGDTGKKEITMFSKLFRSVPDSEKQNTSSVSQNQVDITKNLFYILLCFFICLAPYVISEILDAHYLVKLYASLLLTFNSCVNPILYGVKHPHFRQVFYSILSRRWAEIPEPAFRWMNSGPSRSAVAGSRGNDFDSASMVVSEKIDTL